ncbi:MAG TPA: HAD family hydrolase [Thermoanaerobaculia bacterium]|nr:HAD family hydrolase [Thermoanaerobaculia bacterium]
MLQALTFDVTQTLIHCPRLGEIYADVLARHGRAVEPHEARRLISVVWQELACAAEPGRDRFTAHPGGARGWWQRFLERLCEHLDSPPPSRFAAAELFHRCGRAEAWEVYPEVPGVLDELRRRGLRLGVISNWDERLPGLLEQLDLARRLDAVVYSSAAGIEKPDARIFRQALAALARTGRRGRQKSLRAGLPPACALHVGDHPLNDVEGAQAAGMRAVRVLRHPPPRRRAQSPRLPRPEAPVVHDLSALPELLDGALLGASGVVT